MKKQITYGFAAIFLLIGVFSASAGAAKKPVQAVYSSPAPAPTCDPTDGTVCRLPGH